MKKLRKDKFRKILAFMVALALMVSCVPSAYTISASETFGDGTDDLFTDGEGSSGPEAEESTPDVSSADQEKQAQQTMLTYENDSVKVTAEAQEEGALPQNTSLKADTVNENSSVLYNTVSQKLSKAAEDKGSSLRGFFALDVYFADADGNRVEPNGRVKVTIEYKTPAAPELTDAANTSVTVEKLRYNSSTGETEAYVLQPNEDLKVLNVTETKQVQIIQAETGNSAVFAVMWDSPETVSGEDENSDTPIDSEGNDSDVDISDGEITPEPEVTEVPAEEPEVTEAPTEEPTVTEAPAEEPEVTEAPTEEPTVTEAPAEEPEVTEVPEEEPEITQVPSEEAVIVTVIGDDVNLRVSPSEDADVVTTVEAGTQLTVLETVTAEDGTTWYRVSYEGTEAYIRSDMVQVVETGDEEPAEEEVTDDLTQEGPVTYSKTVGNVVVTATADKDVLPEDAELVVTPVEKDNAQYSEVESQLHAKAEEGDYTVAGFLAYDIYFQDNEGNKIEPNNGSVKVSMDYQASSIPQEIKESTETSTFSSEADEEISLEDENTEATDAQELSVAVMHLVEDEAGNVQSVVDMTQQGTAKVETTAENEIQKAEFETDSFSVFTITWQDARRSLSIQLIDTTGNSIGSGNKSVTWSGNSHTTAYADAPKISGYAFKKAKVASSAGEEGTVVNNVRYNNGKYQYTSDRNVKDTTAWYDIGSNTVYFVYQKVENLKTVETVDHTSDGITMKMKDLWGNSSEKIGPNSDQSTWLTLGGDYGNGNIKRGLLNNVLAPNGYPTVKSNSSNLESLFSGGKTTTVNHLFLKTIYDQTGYYEYSSFNNYAYLGSNPGTSANFTVYDAIGTPRGDSTSYFYSRGNFMPYNAIADGKYASNTHNLYDEDGNELDDSDPDKGKVLYQTQGTNDYQFGMEMDGNFLQPKAGKVTPPNSSKKESMIYEFNGDDDMWIYIDDVLVLDIGGVHDAHSGKINFETGVVSWKDCNTGQVPKEYTTTIKEMFRSAGYFPDGTKWDSSKVDNYFDGDTFRDFTTHSFKMFYMERGAGASNLHMKFNIQVIPEGQVEVRKELSNTDKEKYSNVEFAFQLYAQDIVGEDSQGNEIYSDKYVPLGNGSAVYGNAGKPTSQEIQFGDKEINGTPYKNVFYLKPDESAIFTDLQANRKYYVREIGVKSEEYSQIKINDTGYKEYDEDNKETGEGVIKKVETDKKAVNVRPVVVYTNNCSAANSRELQITKKIKDDIFVEDTFSFRIQLSNQNNVLVPYANGDYYLLDEDNNYWYYNASGALASNGSDAIVCGRKTTDDGIVTGVPAGYTVAVTSILSGTSFRVEEVNLNSEKYDTPDKAVNNADVSVVTDTDGHTADGSIKLGQDANVVVTNTPKNQGQEQDQTFIRISKTFKGLTDTEIGELANAEPPYKITVTGKKLDTETNTYVDFAQDLYLRRDAFVTGSGTTWTYTWKIEGCGTGTYHVTENNYNKNGYSSEVKINGTTIQNPEQNGVDVTTEASTYKYTAKDRVTNCNQQDYEIGVQNLIVAKLTKGQGTFVWTRNPASIDERLAIINIIKSINGFDNNATLDNCYFYSGEGIEGTMIFRGAKIRYDCQNILHFDYPKQWAMFATGTYEITDGRNAEVAIENIYTEITADLDLVKILNSKDSTVTRLTGAEFDLYKKDGNTYSKVNTEPIVIDNDQQEEALRNLSSGQYYLEETKAPDGCTLLADQIYFRQENGTIILTDEDGNALQTENAMWSLSSSDGSNVLTIKNNKIYNLPSAGGPGIYGFTISGVAILATALLLFIKNKRREEEAKRS